MSGGFSPNFVQLLTREFSSPSSPNSDEKTLTSPPRPSTPVVAPQLTESQSVKTKRVKDHTADSVSPSAEVSPSDTHRQMKRDTRKPITTSYDLFGSDSDSEEEEDFVETNSPNEAKGAQLTHGKNKRSVAKPSRAYSHRAGYGFEPRDPAEEARRAMSQSMGSYIPGPEAKTPDELAARKSLRERFLTPQEFSIGDYRKRLKGHARGGSVPSMRTIPVVLAPGESTSEDDMLFRKWVHRTRRLRNYDNLQASFQEKDVRVERRLRFDFAKQKASGKVRQAFHQTLPHGSSAPADTSSRAHQRESRDVPIQGQSGSSSADLVLPATIAGKRVSTGVATADPHDQKRQRRQGSPAGGVPHTPKSSVNVGIPSTSPDTGYDPCGSAAPKDAPHDSGDHPNYRVKVEEVSGLMEILHEQQDALKNHVDSMKRRSKDLATWSREDQERCSRLADDVDEVWSRVHKMESEIHAAQTRLQLLERESERSCDATERFFAESARRSDATVCSLYKLRGQLDLLVRLQQPYPQVVSRGFQPSLAPATPRQLYESVAPAPPRSQGQDPDTA